MSGPTPHLGAGVTDTDGALGENEDPLLQTSVSHGAQRLAGGRAASRCQGVTKGMQTQALDPSVGSFR